jgi:DNA repair protein RadC
MNNKRTRVLEKSPDLAEVKVSYIKKFSERQIISNSRTAFDFLYGLYDKNTIGLKEDFFILLLNRANILLGWFKLSSGGTNGTVADPKLIYILALKTNSSSIIMCHNHPSGNLQPSTTDILLTKKVKDAGSLLEISLFDHLIVSPDGMYFSLADEGLV